MQTTSSSVCLSALAPAGESRTSSPADDRLYQAVTILAILTVLGSLWVF